MLNKRNGPVAKPSVAPEPTSTVTPPQTEAAARQSAPSAAPPNASAQIGAGIHIRGEISGSGDVVIDGSLEGEINLPNSKVTVGKPCHAKGSIRAAKVLVQGTVEGDIAASELVVLSQTANVEGTIKAPRAELHNGGRFKGSIDMDVSPEPKQAAARPPERPVQKASATALKTQQRQAPAAVDSGERIAAKG